MAVAWRSDLRRRLGEQVAGLLAGSWRAAPPPVAMPASALVALAPLLLRSGSAALAWHRIRGSTLRRAPEAIGIQQAYCLSVLGTAPRQRELQEAVTRLRAASVEPVLVKGWAVARLYPEPALRPYGDVDLCVRRADVARARTALREAPSLGSTVDLHEGFATLDESAEDQLFARSVLVDCGGIPVRILEPEDHLRVLCQHLLRHGAARPLWLCDVALAVESRPVTFDWARCLGPDRRVAEWVASTVALAGILLGARLDDAPPPIRTARLPAWLVPAVLREWGQPYRALVSLADVLGQPREALGQLRHHWPNGLMATVALRRSCAAGPRWPLQLVETFRGVVRTVSRLRRRGRASRTGPATC